MKFLTVTLHPSIDRVVALERLTPGEIGEVRRLRIVPAGKGLNTARSLQRLLGRRVRIHAAAWLGRLETPWFQSALAHEGVTLHACKRISATRICTTVLESSGRETHLKESMSAPSPSEELAFLRFSAALRVGGGCAAVCGSAPPRTRAGTLRNILAELRRHARILIADTNGPFLVEAGTAGLDGLKGNALEIGGWLGLRRPFDPKDHVHLRALQAVWSSSKIKSQKSRIGRAPRAVLVTLGAGGALLATPEGLWRAQPPPLPRRTRHGAVGCGDASTAGWMWALADGCGPLETVRRSVACGSAKLLSPDPGGLDRRWALRLLKATYGERLKIESERGRCGTGSRSM